MRQKSKKNNRSRRPPLSLLDKCIYWAGLMLSFLLAHLFIFCYEDIINAIAFRDSRVVAYSSHASILLVMPLLLYLEISTLVLCITALEGKKPIFGNRKIRYGERPWQKDCFPLFDARRKTVYIKPSQKRFRRDMRIAWAAGLLVCALVAPFGLFGRDCLTNDNRIISYNVLNRENSEIYTTEDYSNLTIQAKHVSSFRTADYWKYEIIMEMKDGKSFVFSNGDFDRSRTNYKEMCLEKMIEIKSYYAMDSITIKGAQNIREVADYLGMNAEQMQLLQELFR